MRVTSPRKTLRRSTIQAVGLLAAVLTAAAALAAPAEGSPTATSGDGAPLALTPPMGWNDWAHYQCDFTESTILANANALASSGLAAKGYNTVTIDDCWMRTTRDSSGNLQVDTTRFPDGMPYVANKVHALGLKFGIYEDAGTTTCGGYAGSWNHWTQDANLFASWGVDYVKLDGCNVPTVAGQTMAQTYRSAYQQMGAAMKASGRDMVYSESAPAYFENTADWNDVLGWVGQYGQLWREGYDVATYDASNPTASRWGSVMSNYGYNNPIHRYVSPGNWNDPDFLIAGDGGMTAAESRSQIALWAEMAAPMILSSDVGSLSSSSVADLGNSDVIAVDQDSLGHPGYVVSQNGTLDVLTRPLANGDRAVAILNRSGSTVSASTAATTVGFAGGAGCSYQVKDLWAGTSSTTSGTFGASVPAHGTGMFRVSPSSAACGAGVNAGQISGIAGKCVDDSNSGTTDGNPVILYTCTGNANQRWALSGDGTVRTLGKCLHAAGTTAGSAVDLSTCNGSSAQQWTYQQSGNLTNAASGLCLDVNGGGSADATKLIVWSCGHNQDNQVWSLPS
jgi:alpha-galactosidase